MIAAATQFQIANGALDPIIGRIVGCKVRCLIRSGAIPAQDAEDVEHDLLVRVLQSRSAYDPELAHPYVFVTVVVDRTARNLIRDRQAEKRAPGRTVSLDTDVAVEDLSRQQCDLSLDVTQIGRQLPADLRLLAEQLKSSSVSEVARDQNVSRKVVYRQIRELRNHFEGLA